MASANPLLQQQKVRVASYIDSLRNEDLRTICRAYGQAVSGNKSLLVARCNHVLDDVVRKGDIVAFEDIKARANVIGLAPLQAPQTTASTSSYPSSTHRPYGMAPQRGGGTVSQNRHGSGGKGTGEPGQTGNTFEITDRTLPGFRPSPFYDVLETLLPLHDLPEMPQNRNTVKSNLTINPDLGQRLRNDGNLKIVLYCRESHDPTPLPVVEIKFPNQIEVKVNANDVKHNFKGLKNKAGSTKPADLTSVLFKFGGQTNNIQITYALTTKRFSYGVYLVRYVSADMLVERIKAGNVIPKDKVLQDMNKSNAESDIVATSYTMSLKDPVSTMRINVPIRSSHCTHYQCFDAAMFLQLQEQAPQWNCPRCQKHVSFESLCVDKYFEDILNRTTQDIEDVEVQPNGEWRAIREDEKNEGETKGGSNKARAPYDDDFDDVIELDEAVSKPVNGLKRESMQLPSLSPTTNQSFPIQTPPLSSREASVAQSASSAQRTGNKRPQSTVIDLTLSEEEEEEDDEPPRPAKRQSMMQSQHRRQSGTHPPASSSSSYNTPNSLPDPRLHASPPQPKPPSQQQQHQHHPHQATYHGSGLGQANTYRSASSSHGQRPSHNSGPPRQTFPPNHLSLQHHSLSPSNPTTSSFSPNPASPVWPAPHSRTAATPANPQQQQYPQQYQPQQQQQQQPSPLFPPPSASFPMRPPSTTYARDQQNTSNKSIGGNVLHNGTLRLPPLHQLHQTSTSSFSPDAQQDVFTGWRNGVPGGFDGEWDFGSLGSSPG